MLDWVRPYWMAINLYGVQGVEGSNPSVPTIFQTTKPGSKDPGFVVSGKQSFSSPFRILLKHPFCQKRFPTHPSQYNLLWTTLGQLPVKNINRME